MSRRTVSSRPGSGENSDPVRSLRCDSRVWDAAMRRAEGDGVTISEAVRRLLEAYGRGMVNLPRMVMVHDGSGGGGPAGPGSGAAPAG